MSPTSSIVLRHMESKAMSIVDSVSELLEEIGGPL